MGKWVLWVRIHNKNQIDISSEMFMLLGSYFTPPLLYVKIRFGVFTHTSLIGVANIYYTCDTRSN